MFSPFNKPEYYHTPCQITDNLNQEEMERCRLANLPDLDQDNTEVLKIITPNMLRLGRINTRALSGPLRLPHGASEMVERVTKAYEAWYKIWSDSYVPKLLFKPKWFRADRDLKIGDLVYFMCQPQPVSLMVRQLVVRYLVSWSLVRWFA